MFTLSECGEYITWDDTSKIVMCAEHRNGNDCGWDIGHMDVFVPPEPAVIAFKCWHVMARSCNHKEAANIVREMNRKLHDTPLFTEDGVLIHVDNPLSRASYVAHRLQVDLYNVKTNFDPLRWQILGWNRNAPGGDSGNPHIKIQLLLQEKLSSS